MITLNVSKGKQVTLNFEGMEGQIVIDWEKETFPTVDVVFEEGNSERFMFTEEKPLEPAAL